MTPTSTLVTKSPSDGTLVSTGPNIPLALPDICESDIRAVVDVLQSTRLSLGPKIEEFETRFKEFTGSSYATAVSSGTAALHLAVRALGIGAGDEVITTPFSFVSSANCMIFEGASPVFVDIEPETFNIAPELIPEQITEKTKAILPVHIFGRPARLDKIVSAAELHNLSIIEDACEALGAYWRDTHVGTVGNAGAFAFYPNKQMTTGEGGILVTNDPNLDRLFKSLRNQGRDGDGWNLHHRVGFNYRISDINCALGVSQLERIETFLQQRKTCAELYYQYLHDIDEIKLPIYEIENATISWFVFVIQIRSGNRRERDFIMNYMRDHGIGCSNYFWPIHLQPYFLQAGHYKGEFPVAEAVSASTIALPLFNRLTELEIERVAQILRRAFTKLV